MKRKEPRDIYQDVTDSIIAAIEAGVDDYRMPWHRIAMLPRNVHTNRHYTGINVFSLAAAAMRSGYTHNLWGTYRQWQEVGAQVHKGAKASLVVFYKTYATDPSPDDENDDGTRRVARASYVFNVAQVDGYSVPAVPDRPLLEKVAHAEAFFAALGANIIIGGDMAYYAPVTDHIQMPDERLFLGQTQQERVDNWYGTLGHEAGHWSGHATRLNRDLANRFGSEAYAAEELIALSGQSGCGLSGQSVATQAFS